MGFENVITSLRALVVTKAVTAVEKRTHLQKLVNSIIVRLNSIHGILQHVYRPELEFATDT